MCFEQELTRAYQKATTTSYPPPSACAVLIERQAISTQYQSTSSINTDTTSHNTDQLLHNYVQDVWDKYHRCSELLASRHKMEVEALWLSQRQQWIERNTGEFMYVYYQEPMKSCEYSLLFHGLLVVHVHENCFVIDCCGRKCCVKMWN